MVKLKAKELRVSEPSLADIAKIKRREIYIILDNIMDTYNIGSIFRLADAVVAQKVYLCGAMETPPYHRIAKAGVGTEKWVPWEHKDSVEEAVEDLRKSHSRYDRESDPRFREDDKKKNVKIVAIEQNRWAIDYRKADLSEPIAFIVGHETTGVSKEALKLADEIVELPMYGVNVSLNVMVSLAIILYKTIE